MAPGQQFISGQEFLRAQPATAVPLKLENAQRLLATTDESVTDIAFQSGFNSISRFNDAFRRACGCSPRDYRQSHE